MLGFVLYTDGGCRGWAKFTGAGVHGYVWDSSLTYRGVGMTSHVLTPMGYFPKMEATDVFSQVLKTNPDLSTLGAAEFMKKYSMHRVTPVAFYDGFETVGTDSTNNVAELQGLVDGLQAALEYHHTKAKLGVVTIRADSKYALETVVDNMYTWASNGFRTTMGEPVKNTPHVVTIIDLFKKIEEAGILVVREHVRAHEGEPGNESADYLSTIALFQAHNFPKGGFRMDKTSGIEKYWKTGSEQRHPMLSHRFTYFDTFGIRREKGTYYMGNQGREIELLGKRESDGAYGVVRMKEQVPVLEHVVDAQMLLPAQVETLVMMDVDAVYGANHRFFDLFGALCLRRINEHRNDLIAQDKTLITREYSPALLAHRVYDSVSRLETILDSFLATYQAPVPGGINGIQSANITETFFDVVETEKKGEVVRTTKIRDDIPVGLPSIDVLAHFAPEEGEEPLKEVLRLNMGIDLPDRNAMRGLAEKNPKVHAVTWRIGVGFHNYAVVIECDDAVGIWAGMCSNLRLIGTAAEEQARQLARIKLDAEERAAKRAKKKAE